MFYPFLVADPFSGDHYRLSDARLAELSMAPRASEWSPAQAITDFPEPVWEDSLSNAKVETIATVSAALENLILSTNNLETPDITALPASRAKTHLKALIKLWERLGTALPEGLLPIRHVLNLPAGRFLTKLPVVEGTLDINAPAIFIALYERLKSEFDSVPSEDRLRLAPQGSGLHAIQAGISSKTLNKVVKDCSLQFYGLRDEEECADFAAAHARKLIECGCAPKDIAVLSAGRLQHIQRAFRRQGIAMSGFPNGMSKRDVPGETAFNLLLAKRTPTPAMVLASLAISPLMPWDAHVGRALSEELMKGNFKAHALTDNAAHRELWSDIRQSASSNSQLRFLLEKVCNALSEGRLLRARLMLPSQDGSPDWEEILQAVQIMPAEIPAANRTLEGVSIWRAHESPWRKCRHLIVTDFTEGNYPSRPTPNPMFLDSEVSTVNETLGLKLQGRKESLARNLKLVDEQIQAVTESICFLIPWRDLNGKRRSPATGLSLVSRAVQGVDGAEDLITDLASSDITSWPVNHYFEEPAAPKQQTPDVLEFARCDLTELRKDQDGVPKPQSPSRLETLIISPFAWLLAELGAEDLSWGPEKLDRLLKGNIAHDVFEHVFIAGKSPPAGEELRQLVKEAYEQALIRNASFLNSAIWEMENRTLLQEIQLSAERWQEHLASLGATVIDNEIWLHGWTHGVSLHGKVDTILRLPNDDLLIVDHKKSGTKKRKERMEKGWDLQAGLYRDMIANPIRKDGDKMGSLLGYKSSVAYYLMNDGGLLVSGVDIPPSIGMTDMGAFIDENAINCLENLLRQVRSGHVELNTTDDEKRFEKERGITPYALKDGSPLVRTFQRAAEEA